MKSLVIVLFILFFISTVCAICSEGQIDINSASAEELDKIVNVGPTIAQNIINSRQFNSIDDLINVNRIGPKILDEIKQQGLACVEGDAIESELEEKSLEEIKLEEETNLENQEIKEDKEIQLEEVNLNTKGIKSEEDKEVLKKNLALAGIAIFGAVFGALFFFRRRKYKNEFN